MAISSTIPTLRTGFSQLDQTLDMAQDPYGELEPSLTSGPPGLVWSRTRGDPEEQAVQSVRQPADRSSALSVEPLQARSDGSSGYIMGANARPVLQQLAQADEVDSFFVRTIRRQVELIWGRGWQLESDNPAAARYVQQRLKLIEQTCRRPILDLFQSITRYLVRDGECFILKGRAGRRRGRPPVEPTLPGLFVQVRDPILALYELEPQTVQLDLDPDTKQLVSYTQSLDGQQRTYERRDIIHLTYRKRAGYHRGRSYLQAALPDLRAFRIMEDRLMVLLQKYIFPLTLYRVGVGRQRRVHPKEIQRVISVLKAMPPGGTLVAAGDHDIQSLGAESKALRAEGYTRIFQNRLFAGLGMSELQFGIGQNVNRNTGELLAGELEDVVRHWQQYLDVQLGFFLFNELLIEGGFDPLNRPEDVVHLKFPPVTLAEQLRIESHWIQKWQNEGCTLDDYWKALGSGPADANRWKRSRHWLVRVPLAELQAMRGFMGGPSSEASSSDGSAQADPASAHVQTALDLLLDELAALSQQVQQLTQKMEQLDRQIDLLAT